MINVRPRPYHIPAKEAKALADWFLRKYIEPYVKDEQPTFIDISFNKKIDTLGLCTDEQDNEYLVEGNPINGYNHMMKTLCHELIHVKQYRLGEMKAVTGGTKWKKKKYNLSTPYMIALGKQKHLSLKAGYGESGKERQKEDVS